MAHEVRFQVGILPDVEWKSFIGRFQHVEALGFDMAGTGDQFVDSMDNSRPWFDLWAALAAVAQGTESLRIAPYVAQIPMRDPATLARQVLTVDHISNGRVEVGLGLGRPVAASYRMMGIPTWDNAERVERFGEYVEIVEHMLSNTETTYEGRYYRGRIIAEFSGRRSCGPDLGSVQTPTAGRAGRTYRSHMAGRIGSHRARDCSQGPGMSLGSPY
jgi:hypothetical protein